MAARHERSEPSRSTEFLQQMETYPRVFFLESGEPTLRHVVQPLGESFKQNATEAKKSGTPMKPHFLVVKGEPVSGKSHMLRETIRPYFDAEDIPVHTIHWEQVMHALKDIDLIQTDLSNPLQGHENSLVSGFLSLHAGLNHLSDRDLPPWEDIQEKIIKSPVVRSLGKQRGELEERFLRRMREHTYTKTNFEAVKEILGHADKDALTLIEVPGGTSLRQDMEWIIPSRAYAPTLIHDMVYNQFPFDLLDEKVVAAVGAVGDPFMEDNARQRSAGGDQGATPTQIIKARAAAEAAVYFITETKGEKLPDFIREIVGQIPLNETTSTLVYHKQAEEYRKLSDKIAVRLGENPDKIFRAVCYRLAVSLVLENELCLAEEDTKHPNYASVVHVKPTQTTQSEDI